MKITLDENHIYKVDGAVIPGVSEILQSAGIVDTRWHNDAACIRGTYVHKAVELYHTVGLNMNSLDDVIKPYFEAYMAFLQTARFHPIAVEKEFYHSTYMYCGKPDLVGYLNGDLVLLDIKTGSVSKWAELQTAAYKALIGRQVDSKPINYRAALNLKSNGKWNLIPYKENAHHWEVFQSALTIYHYKQGKI